MGDLLTYRLGQGLQGEEGMTIYYIPPYDGQTQVTAFAPVREPAQDPCTSHDTPSN